MARVSKRIAARAAISSKRQVSRYRAGIYARLSSDQDKVKNESVEMQVKIAEKYIEELNEKQAEQIEIVDRYIDLGKTGSNFKRDEFGRLMQDIRLGEINCIVVKDLSRFGRNYLEAGNYIEKIFPFLGVRFIAVSDRFDTGMDGNEKKQMAVEIKNLINDMYAKDASLKRKQSLKQIRQAGGYVGGPAPYGYLAEYEKKVRKLKPDENTADIVRYIFERFIGTASCSAVADDLNGRRINSPTIYRQTGEVFFSEREGENYRGWDRSAVERIVKSETYVGRLVQGKTSITARDESNRVHKPEDEWCIKDNAHEPLVDVGVFEQARETLQKIHEKSRLRNHPAKECAISENIFDEVMYCGACGRKMTRYSQIKTCQGNRKQRIDGYFCLNSGQTKVDICPETNRILKEPLVDILMQLFRVQFAVYLKKPKKYIESVEKKLSDKKKELENRHKKIRRNIEMIREKEGFKYVQYKEGEISQKEYVAYKIQQEDRRRDLDRQLAQVEDEMKKAATLAEKVPAMVRAILHMRSGKELTKEMVEALIDRIYVYPGKRVEISWGYTDELLREVLKHE